MKRKYTFTIAYSSGRVWTCPARITKRQFAKLLKHYETHPVIINRDTLKSTRIQAIGRGRNMTIRFTPIINQ